MRFSVLLSTTLLAASALAAPVPLASSNSAATGFLLTRAITTPLAQEAKSFLSTAAAFAIDRTGKKEAIYALQEHGLKEISGAALTKLISAAEEGSKSANAALEKAIKAAPDNMVFGEDGSDRVRKLVFDQYKKHGGITGAARTSQVIESSGSSSEIAEAGEAAASEMVETTKTSKFRNMWKGLKGWFHWGDN